MSNQEGVKFPPVHKIILDILETGTTKDLVDAYAIPYSRRAKVPREDIPQMIAAFEHYLGLQFRGSDIVIKAAIKQLQRQLEIDEAGASGSELPVQNIEIYLKWFLSRSDEILGIFRNEGITAKTLAQASIFVGIPCESVGMFLTDLAGERIFLYRAPSDEVIFGIELDNPASSDDPIFFLAEHKYTIFGPFDDRETAVTVLKSLWPDAVNVD